MRVYIRGDLTSPTHGGVQVFDADTDRELTDIQRMTIEVDPHHRTKVVMNRFQFGLQAAELVNDPASIPASASTPAVSYAHPSEAISFSLMRHLNSVGELKFQLSALPLNLRDPHDIKPVRYKEWRCNRTVDSQLVITAKNPKEVIRDTVRSAFRDIADVLADQMINEMDNDDHSPYSDVMSETRLGVGRSVLQKATSGRGPQISPAAVAKFLTAGSMFPGVSKRLDINGSPKELERYLASRPMAQGDPVFFDGTGKSDAKVCPECRGTKVYESPITGKKSPCSTCGS